MNLILNKKTKVIDLGLIDYKKSLDHQTDLFGKLVDIKIENRSKTDDFTPTDNFLIFCQHPHVYTLGKSGKEKNLLIGQEKLSSINASYYHTNRGGDITYHGPGQLVVYPILDLENFFTDIHQYMRLLEESVIQTCKSFNIEAGRIAGLTGVWVNPQSANTRKICAMGVKMSRWVTMHGLALNVNGDLSYFDNIIACGIADKSVTSIKKETGTEPDFEAVKEILKNKIAEQFSMELI